MCNAIHSPGPYILAISSSSSIVRTKGKTIAPLPFTAGASTDPSKLLLFDWSIQRDHREHISVTLLRSSNDSDVNCSIRTTAASSEGIKPVGKPSISTIWSPSWIFETKENIPSPGGFWRPSHATIQLPSQAFQCYALWTYIVNRPMANHDSHLHIQRW